ncbi:hypothetical protein O181_070766 [Austropuccinia psidii MF-1]|uniref:Uncharacterized protein n=1 Tax=Austropuccinia psidii MF-1 TaxID=1389203 RepID=A0A9Q3F616_9BASI|nr:hypothetical protein [Austropuccinia psidii MF-1]
MISDVLTKALGTVKHHQAIKLLRLVQPDKITGGGDIITDLARIFATDVITDLHHCCGLINSLVYILVSNSFNSHFQSVPSFTSTIHSSLFPPLSLRPNDYEP